jgi:hypothetical protein
MSGSMNIDDPSGGASSITLGSSSLGSALMDLLNAQDIQPGAEPSYQLCKTILLYHPLGAKLVEAPIRLAQSQKRRIEVAGAPERVAEVFEREWDAIRANRIIRTGHKIARAYGIATIVVGAKGIASDRAINPEQYAANELFFNVLDPLNTSGSLVLAQDPNAPTFQKAVDVTTQGQTYHRSRCCIILNEEPIYIAFTSSAFGYVGRSVYQRVLFPLKSFIQSMRTDDMVVRKVGVLVAKMKAPSSIVNRAMQSMLGMERALLKQAETDNVLGIDIEESIESLNMNNVDGAGTFARTNILKNLATGADMPAVLLENETLTQGFGEGEEDAKTIARYIEEFREEMKPTYDFMDEIVQYRAWNKGFYKELQKSFPEQYGKMKYEVALSTWQNKFTATWPSLLIEPESERVKTDDVKLRAIIGVIETIAPLVDPPNKAILMDWAQDNIADTELLFSVPLQMDTESLAEYDPMAEQAAMQNGQGGPGGPGQPGQPGGGQQGMKVMPFKPHTGLGA